MVARAFYFAVWGCLLVGKWDAFACKTRKGWFLQLIASLILTRFNRYIIAFEGIWYGISPIFELWFNSVRIVSGFSFVDHTFTDLFFEQKAFDSNFSDSGDQ